MIELHNAKERKISEFSTKPDSIISNYIIKNRIFLFLVLMSLNSCNNTTEPYQVTGSLYEIPVVPGLVITGKNSPDVLGIWRNPHLPDSYYSYYKKNNHIEVEVPVIPNYILRIPYPNPTNHSNTINFSLPIETKVNLTLVKARLPEDKVKYFDMYSGGSMIAPYNRKTIVLIDNKIMSAGSYEFSWSGKDEEGEKAESGFYRVYLKAGAQIRWCDILLAREITDLPPDLRKKISFDK